MTYEIVGWVMVIVAVGAVGWGGAPFMYWRRLRQLRREAKRLVSAHGAGLFYGLWVENRASEFPDGAWQSRARRELMECFEREMKHCGCWEQHFRLRKIIEDASQE